MHQDIVPEHTGEYTGLDRLGLFLTLICPIHVEPQQIVGSITESNSSEKVVTPAIFAVTRAGSGEPTSAHGVFLESSEVVREAICKCDIIPRTGYVVLDRCFQTMACRAVNA